MNKITMIIAGMAASMTAMAQTPVYLNTFDTQEEQAECSIVGDGSFADEEGYGKVFQNAQSTTPRTNYLLLPENVLTLASESKAITIGFWVNVKSATDYWFSPIFSAYAEAPHATSSVATTSATTANADAYAGNSWPMFVLQSRLLAQLNCAGWCNFTNAQNANGENTESTFWLDDKAWHYYAYTQTETNAKVYVDGVVKNEWTVTGSGDGEVIGGLFSGASMLKYVCLGGNQAWEWADKDAGYAFDDFAIYNSALTDTQIKAVMAAKKGTATAVGGHTDMFDEVESVSYINITGQEFDMPQRGINIVKTTYMDGHVEMRKMVR